MNPRVKQILRTAAPYVPGPVTRVLRYPKETLFVNRIMDFEGGDPSVVFFTMNKCASMLMSRIMSLINKRALGLTHLNLDSYLWDAANMGQDGVHEHLARRPEFYFRDTGILYAPIRDYVDISHMHTPRVFVMLRDPRDVMVSYYFSIKYAHRPPSNPVRRRQFHERRKTVSDLSLEEFVLRFAPGLEARYAPYRQNIQRDRVLTYEQMWADFGAFADELARVMEVDLSESLRRQLMAMASFKRNGQENIRAHQRKGEPGDHREKLSADVIARLDSIFGDSLTWLYG